MKALLLSLLLFLLFLFLVAVGTALIAIDIASGDMKDEIFQNGDKK